MTSFLRHMPLPPAAEMVDEIGAPYESAFARLDACLATTSARRMLEPYAKARP